MLQYFNPLRWFRWFGQFIVAWGQSLDWLDLSYGVPAILLTLALGTGAVIAYTGGNEWRTRLLDDQLQHALEIDDFDTAALLLRRQLKDTPDNLDRLLRFGSVLDAQAKRDEALSLMRDLVQVKGNEQAARWIVMNEYQGRGDRNWSSLSEDEQREFASLLKLISEAAPNDLAVKRAYAELLIASEKYSLALPLLAGLIDIEPMRGLQAAAISRKFGNPAQADRFAELALAKVDKMLAEDPRNADLAIAVAQNQLFLHRFAEASRVLKLAIERAKTPEDENRLRQGLAESIVSWIGYIEKSPTNTASEKLRVMQMLQVALLYAPNNPRVLSLVADRVLGTLDETDEGLVEVRQSLISGSSPGISHFIQGTVGLMRDDMKSAMFHLELASEMMPNASAILNNLAVAISRRPDADLENALEISNAAIAKATVVSPHYYDTRGQIQFQLKRYIKAIPDLERALPEPSLARDAHRLLAICYHELDQKELGDDHQKVYERMSEGAAAEIGPELGGDSDGDDAAVEISTDETKPANDQDNTVEPEIELEPEAAVE